MIFEANVKRILERLGLDGPVTARLTDNNSLAVAQIEAEGADRARAGRAFGGMFSTTGIAPVQAVPTTAAAFALYNADKSRSIMLDEIDIALLSGTAGIGMTLLGIISQITATLPPAAAGSVVGSLSGSAMGSNAILAINYTLPTPSKNAQWSALKCIAQCGGIPGVGGGFTFEPKGRFLIPPGYVGGFTMLAPAGTTPLFLGFPKWSELIKDTE